MVDRVTLNEEAAPSDDPQLDEAQEESPEKVEEQTEEQTEEQEEPSERPEWLNSKFETPEDMARAYSNLEKKLGSRQAEEQGLLTADDLDKYSEEYGEEGLTDKSNDELAKKGLTREVVDRYINGQEHVAAGMVSELHELAGGKEGYESMSKWAGESLAPDELEAFNTAVQSGEVGQAKLAIRGLYSQYRQGNPVPQLVQGGKANQVGGYGSLMEMTNDMKDPRYQAGDRNFHAHVESRIASTSGDII